MPPTRASRRPTTPTGPEGETRPADLIANAVRVMQIATGEAEEEFEADDGKDKGAQALGRSGAARAASMTPERRAEIARAGAAKRWGRQQAEERLINGIGFAERAA